jgi:hypothetical protein
VKCDGDRGGFFATFTSDAEARRALDKMSKSPFEKHFLTKIIKPKWGTPSNLNEATVTVTYC